MILLQKVYILLTTMSVFEQISCFWGQITNIFFVTSISSNYNEYFFFVIFIDNSKKPLLYLGAVHRNKNKQENSHCV